MKINDWLGTKYVLHVYLSVQCLHKHACISFNFCLIPTKKTHRSGYVRPVTLCVQLRQRTTRKRDKKVAFYIIKKIPQFAKAWCDFHNWSKFANVHIRPCCDFPWTVKISCDRRSLNMDLSTYATKSPHNYHYQLSTHNYLSNHYLSTYELTQSLLKG